jgi:hypothetical protein
MMDEVRESFHNSRVSKALFVVFVLLSVFLVAKTITELRNWQYIGLGVIPTNTISVQGEGEVFAIPDVATFSFSVIKEAGTAQEAQDMAATVANNATDYLKGQGIEDKDIKTTNYSVYPRYEYPQIYCITYPCPQGERKLVGFEITQTMTVKVRDTKKAGELLSGIGELGIDQISGLSFTIDDEDAVQREARQKAVTDAREKAKALADDLGVRLVRVVNFNEYNSPIYYGYAEAAGFGMGGDTKAVPSIEPGENRITSQVNITYEIR